MEDKGVDQVMLKSTESTARSTTTETSQVLEAVRGIAVRMHSQRLGLSFRRKPKVVNFRPGKSELMLTMLSFAVGQAMRMLIQTGLPSSSVLYITLPSVPRGANLDQ